MTAMARQAATLLCAAPGLAAGLVLGRLLPRPLFIGVLVLALVGAGAALLRRRDRAPERPTDDTLTGLPKQALFRDRVRQALLVAERQRKHVCLLILGLDHFKEVNRTLGHAAGDELLRLVADRLRDVLRESDTITRLGSDEFAVLLPAIHDAESSFLVVNKIRIAFETPFMIEGMPLEVEASIGVALAPEHANDADTLMQRAGAAMYLAKASQTGYEIYADGHDEDTVNRLAMVAELRRAIEERQLILHYQPKISLNDERVSGVEALVRWEHPDHGLMPPDRFIPLAEQTDLIRSMTLYIVDAALKQCREWQDAGRPLKVAVNLSPRNLLDTTIPDRIAELLHKWNVDPSFLELEITERTIVQDSEQCRDVLTRLSELGVRLAIDDFGTGFSSLGYLRALPINEIKIDKSFVINLMDSENDGVIVRSTLDLARNLGLDVVAEGVENQQVLDELAGLGCNSAQGYFVSRPMPAAALALN